MLGLLGGASGIAGIYTFVVRPRVNYHFRAYRIVRLADKNRVATIEKALTAQGLPLAMAEVLWWNGGRRAATDLSIEITVPGEVRDTSMTPEAYDVVNGWVEEVDPISSPSNTWRIRQPRLMECSTCVAGLGFVPSGKELEPQVSVHLKDRRVRHVDEVAAVRKRVSRWVIAALFVSNLIGVTWYTISTDREFFATPANVGDMVVGTVWGLAVGLLLVSIFFWGQRTPLPPRE